MSEFFDAFEEAQAAAGFDWTVSGNMSGVLRAVEPFEDAKGRETCRSLCPVTTVIRHRYPDSDIEVESSARDMAEALGMAVCDVTDITLAADADTITDVDGEEVSLYCPKLRAELVRIVRVAS